MKHTAIEGNVHTRGLHGTSLAAAESIARQGFHDPNDAGVYFAVQKSLAQRYAARMGGGDPHAIISAIFPPHPEEPGSQGDFREVQLSGPEITAITVARIAIFNPDGTKNPAESARLMAILQEARDLTQQPTDTPIVCSR